MGFQWFSFVTMLGTIAEFCIQFWALNWNFALAPAWGHGFDGQALVLGVVAFSWAFVITSMYRFGPQLISPFQSPLGSTKNKAMFQ